MLLFTLSGSTRGLDATGGGNRGKFFRVAVDAPCEGHDILLDGNTDVLSAKAGVEFQFVNNVLPEL
jgi:hypothetical protein